jgi:Zn ribbon nucleic-acid-binding protein
VALFVAVEGGQLELLPMWVGIVGLVVGGSDKGFRRDENVPLFGEILGRLLAGKGCPSCGQSIFDHTQFSGYTPDTQTHCWWPSKYCTNCGHDMRRATSP